jgi:hypothetical protein
MEVIDLIDLIDDEAPQTELRRTKSAQETRITSRDGRKAANRIAHNRPDLDWARITAAVQAFCVACPEIRDIDQIVASCEPSLVEIGKRQGGIGKGHSDFDPADYDFDDSQVNVLDSQSDEVRIMTATTPMVEILRLFPNAKKEFVQALLEKHGHNTELVVQSMLDNGYEKEESKNTSNGQGSSSEPPAPTVDFTSAAWETSAAYRKDALAELARNFPFITQPSLAVYFKKEKCHFYHTLMGVEKTFKLPALQFAPGRVQNLAAAVGAEELSPTSGALDSSSSSGGTSEGTPTERRTPPKRPVTVSLLDSQSESQGDVIELVSPPLVGSNAPSKPNKTQFLNKQQVAELRKRANKDVTGLAVKSVVMSVYRAHCEYNLSYELQPLDSVLQREITFIADIKQRELMQADQAAAEKLNEELATAEGSLMECGCCYGEYAFEALVQCSEGHLFCKQCLQRYCEQTVFGKCLCSTCYIRAAVVATVVLNAACVGDGDLNLEMLVQLTTSLERVAEHLLTCITQFIVVRHRQRQVDNQVHEHRRGLRRVLPG